MLVMLTRLSLRPPMRDQASRATSQNGEGVTNGAPQGITRNTLTISTGQEAALELPETVPRRSPHVRGFRRLRAIELSEGVPCRPQLVRGFRRLRRVGSWSS